MLAILLTLGLFAFWLLVGQALLALFRHESPLSRALLAPAVGFAATVVPIFLLSRAGLAVGRFAWVLAAGLAAGAALTLWRLRPRWSRSYLPFAAVLLGALVLTGTPMFRYGLDWVSYCNDDMANYCLRGERLREHAFADLPADEDLYGGRDYTQYMYYFDVAGMVRMGSDLVLAWVASLTGVPSYQAFMPLILAFHLLLLSAAAALVCPGEEQRGRGLMVCCLMALSALTSLGTLYQLIAQVGGLSLLAACAALLLRPMPATDRHSVMCHGLLLGLLGTALMLVYPEAAPFLGVALLGYVAVAHWRGQLAPRPLLASLGLALAVGLVLLNTYALRVGFYITAQVQHSHLKELTEIFPYYLLPSGPATLWGLIPLAGMDGTGPLFWTALVAGWVLLLAAAVATVVLSRRGEAVGVMTLVMFGLAAFMAAAPDGFALFKLAMFVQPFLLGSLAVAWWGLARRPALRVLPLLALALAGLSTQRSYVAASHGRGSAYVEIPNASGARITREFRRALAAAPVGRLVLDSYNPSLVKFQAMIARGIPVAVPSRDYFYVMAAIPDLEKRAALLSAQALDLTRKMVHRIHAAQRACLSFRLFDEKDGAAVNQFWVNHIGRPAGAMPPGTYVALSTGKLTVLNRYHFPPQEKRNFVLAPWHDVHNHLIFTTSMLGQHYFNNFKSWEVDRRVALCKLEPDPNMPGETFCSCGRHVLFEVVNPTPGARLLLALSVSNMADGDNRLPPAAAVGDGRYPFPLVGRGSARVFSPPLATQVITGIPYLGLDLGAEAKCFPTRRVGLMRLYGIDLPSDSRRLVGFTRDVSLVSGEEYAQLRAPTRVEKFPQDLECRGLEYSGVYEDGWASEACFFALARPAGPARVVVRGMVPGLDDNAFTTELTVLMDGQEVARRTLRPGDFEVAAPAPAGYGRGRVELRFSRFQQLPGGDGRPTGCLLKAVALEPAKGGTGLAAVP